MSSRPSASRESRDPSRHLNVGMDGSRLSLRGPGRQPLESERTLNTLLRPAGLASLILLAVTPASADAVADFYKGKTVTLIAGFPPGGGYDTYVRILARHYGRFIPGQPAVVATN